MLCYILLLTIYYINCISYRFLYFHLFLFFNIDIFLRKIDLIRNEKKTIESLDFLLYSFFETNSKNFRVATRPGKLELVREFYKHW